MTGRTWTVRLLDQLTFHWEYQLRPRLEGLGDDELTWEPAPGVSTIEWRLSHLTGDCFGARNERHFGGPPVPSRVPARGAAAALARLDEQVGLWVGHVTALDETALLTPVGDKEPFPELTVADLVLHIHRELIHHGAEISLLRDLYPHRETA